MIRSGAVEKTGRPLSLVVVDEAHNLGLASGGRGLRLELLLATLNREARDASFLLLTPFVPNAKQIAEWLDPDNNQAVELGLEWLPNDRVIGLSKLEAGQKRGEARLIAEAHETSAESLHTEQRVILAEGKPLGLPYSKLDKPNMLAAATSDALGRRGLTVTLVGQARYSWNVAQQLADSSEGIDENPDVAAVSRLLADEYGPEFPLAGLLRNGVGVHHAGLGDDIRTMVEALAERGWLRHVVATTTLAQGINFPISNVVLATHQYPYGETIPPEDFWNIAGRAGRANHGEPGIVLLAAPSSSDSSKLESYLRAAADELGSTLVDMVRDALDRSSELDLASLRFVGGWSSFLQFVAHTYRTVGRAAFAEQVEQVLRGTLGFRELRSVEPDMARQLVDGVRRYAAQLSGKPVALVDSTGFSCESVLTALAQMNQHKLGSQLLDDSLFEPQSDVLAKAIGVLLEVPELHDQLVKQGSGGPYSGDFLARVVKDWVGGLSLAELATRYFARTESEAASASITRCCQRMFGSILPSISWGLAAMQTMTLATDADATADSGVRDMASFVFYGVDSRAAIALRLFGVSRTAALAMARTHGRDKSIEDLRRFVAESSIRDWTDALGDVGEAYFRAWRLAEPIA